MGMGAMKAMKRVNTLAKAAAPKAMKAMKRVSILAKAAAPKAMKAMKRVNILAKKAAAPKAMKAMKRVNTLAKAAAPKAMKGAGWRMSTLARPPRAPGDCASSDVWVSPHSRRAWARTGVSRRARTHVAVYAHL